MKKIAVCVVVSCFWGCLAQADTFEERYQQGKMRFDQAQYALAGLAVDDAMSLALTPEEKAQSTGLLGLIYYRMQRWETATQYLQAAIALNSGEDNERSKWLGALADLEADQDHMEQARQHYTQALAKAKGNLNLTIGLALGQVETLSEAERWQALEHIKNQLTNVENVDVKAALWINLGLQAYKFHTEAGVALALMSFQTAAQLSVNHPRLYAQATGQLAQLYEAQQRIEEALTLNSAAIEAATPVEASDLLLELQWRQGRLYRALNQFPQATVAYQQAIEHIESIRQDIPVDYHNGQSSFRTLLEPVYLGLADLLLLQASEKNGEEKTVLLRRARETVELIKQSELEDFLGGRCAVHSSKKALLEAVEPSTAIIYPILLPDRLELLVSSGSDISQYTQAVSRETLQTLAKHLASSLRTQKYDIKKTSQQLYHWLVQPIEPWLAQQHIKTLVMVPDGVLRLIPPAALYDGKNYLIEKYAIATSPGLTLFEPAPLQKKGIHALLAGMSEPGEVVEHLPPVFLQSLLREQDIEEAVFDTNAQGSQDTLKSRQIELSRKVKDPIFRQHIQERLSLPGVLSEITQLEKTIPNTTIINDAFTLEHFKKQVLQAPYTVVHIASHGVFGRTADTSFIMAYDNLITMNELERLLRSDKFATQPLELLTLSACQTAEGDDRAPLGLSGIALKAKVRSALGTLWPVSDEAASLLMAEFYKALAQQGVSKVEALRIAQLSLIKQKNLENPFYWSPFILAGNWL